jgi:N6-adenosine-specific RNA methylase IME4
MAVVETLEELNGQKFGAIYADPPWTFRVYSGAGKNRSAEQHYENTLSQQELEAWPVAGHAAEDCALFMWAVMPQIPEALQLMAAWGFEYKTVAFTWTKLNKSGSGFFTGMGYWTRANAELCLLGTRGSPKRQAKDVPQLVVAPRGAHSAKPSIVQERIQQLVPGPYLELFARRVLKDWTVLGNEVQHDLFSVGEADG